MISISIVNWYMSSNGWTFKPAEGAIPDNINERICTNYTKVDPKYSGRVTVPALWDKKTETIVSNDLQRLFVCLIALLMKSVQQKLIFIKRI